MEDTLANLTDLVKCLSHSHKKDAIGEFFRNQAEIKELELLSTFHSYDTKSAVKYSIELSNQKYGIFLDVDYFASRWKKLYHKSLNASFDDVIKEQVKRRDGRKCMYCKYDQNIEIHHVIPQSKHGSNSQYNLVCACKTCNLDIGAYIRLPTNWWELHPDSRNKPV